MRDSVRTYTGRQLDHIAFPLGGIGAGCVSLGGWGQLRDWEIFNSPNKGYQPQGTFMAVRAELDGRSHARALRGVPGGSYVGAGRAMGPGATVYEVGGGHGFFDHAAGFPPFQSCSFTGMFPLARIDFQDDEFPLQAALEAFSPFIPLDDGKRQPPAGRLSGPSAQFLAARGQGEAFSRLSRISLASQSLARTATASAQTGA